MKNKKILIGVIILCIVILIAAIVYYTINNNNSVETEKQYKKVGDHYEFEYYYDGPSTGTVLPPNSYRDE